MRRLELGEADGVDQLARAVVERGAASRSERQKSNECPRLRCSAMRTFSSTVRCGNTAEIWNERTSPMRAIAAGREPVISRPLKKIWPRVGRQEVREQVEAGRLAGAVRADQRVDRAATHRQVDVLDGDEALELLGEPARLENRVVGHAAAIIRIGAPTCNPKLPSENGIDARRVDG